MAADIEPPPGLGAYLAAGCDLEAIPDLEQYARVIVISRHAVAEETRDRLAAHFWGYLNTWLDGDDVVTPEGETLEPTFDRIRQAMWLCEGLSSDETAKAFEAALPPALRAVCLARVAEVEGTQP